MSAHELLKKVRENLGISTDFVERQLRLKPDLLAQIEAGELEIDTAVLDQLSLLYGVAPADVACGAPLDEVLAPVRVLLKASAVSLSEKVRSDIARVAAARREVIDLERLLDHPDRYEALRAQFLHEGNFGGEGEEWRIGKQLAEQLRENRELGLREPISSMRALVESLGIELAEAELSDGHVAGFSLADPRHGPAIVINTRGANANPWVRRFTMAHELCHVLHDELIHEDVPPVQLYEDHTPAAADRRANSFAAHLLAPDGGVRELMTLDLPDDASIALRVWAIMDRFGINFMAARLRLRHVWMVPLAELEELSGVRTHPGDDSYRNWIAAELSRYTDAFPCPSVPRERRGSLAQLVAEALAGDMLDRRQALEILHAAPDESIEELLDLGLAE